MVLKPKDFSDNEIYFAVHWNTKKIFLLKLQITDAQLEPTIGNLDVDVEFYGVIIEF